jgi:hypothetical protein
MKINNILDYYPCGYYDLTKNGEEKMCNLQINLSERGAAIKGLDQLYSIKEHFTTSKKNKYIILIIFLILFLATIKKIYIYNIK